MRVTLRVLDQTTELTVFQIVQVNHHNCAGLSVFVIVTYDTKEANVLTIHVDSPVTRDTSSFETERHPDSEESFVEEERDIPFVIACIETE